MSLCYGERNSIGSSLTPQLTHISLLHFLPLCPRVGMSATLATDAATGGRRRFEGRQAELASPGLDAVVEALMSV